MLLRNFSRQRKGTGFNRGGKNKNRSNSKSLSRRWAPKLRNVYVYRLPNRSGRHPRPTSRDDLINARLIVIYPDYHNRVYKPSHRLIIINLPCRRKRHGIIATVALLINARFVLEEEEEGGVAAAGDEVARWFIRDLLFVKAVGEDYYERRVLPPTINAGGGKEIRRGFGRMASTSTLVRHHRSRSFLPFVRATRYYVPRLLK